MAYIKNISHEEAVELASQINCMQGQIVSKTLCQNKYVSMTLFAFSKGEEISKHESKGDAMVYVLEGQGAFDIEDKEYVLEQGECLVMPAQKPHAVRAVENFKMLLVVIFPV